MKKLHILISSLAVATTLPILCAVSCGAATSKWNLKDGEFKWTHDLASGSVNSEEEATNRYFNEIDNKLLADDLIKTETDHVLSDPEAYVEASIVVKVSKIDKKEHRLTFSIDCEFVEESYDNKLETVQKRFNFVNFPMELSCDEYITSIFNDYDENEWKLTALSDDDSVCNEGVMPEVYRNDSKWSFTCYINRDGDITSGTINSKTEETTETVSIMENCFKLSFVSYYFRNVILNQ